MTTMTTRLPPSLKSLLDVTSPHSTSLNNNTNTAQPFDYVAQCTVAFANLCRFGTSDLDADNGTIVSHFHSVREPPISLTDYIRRLELEAKCGEDGFLIALILIGRACNSKRSAKTLLPSVLTAHRLFLTGLRVATKSHHDIHRSNRTFAKLGGVENRELNLLEWLFLERINFNATVYPEEVERVKTRVQLAYAAGSTNGIAAAAHHLAHGMRLEVTVTRMPPPAVELLAEESNNVTSPQDTPQSGSPAGCGRSAARTLRARHSTSTNHNNNNSSGAAALSLSQSGNSRPSHNSSLMMSTSMIVPSDDLVSPLSSMSSRRVSAVVSPPPHHDDTTVTSQRQQQQQHARVHHAFRHSDMVHR